MSQKLAIIAFLFLAFTNSTVSQAGGFMRWVDKVNDGISGNIKRFDLDDSVRSFLNSLDKSPQDTNKIYNEAREIYKVADSALDYCQVNNLEPEDSLFRGTDSEMFLCTHLRKKKDLAFDLLELTRDYRDKTQQSEIINKMRDYAQQILRAEG
jgi:hypothetical protein